MAACMLPRCTGRCGALATRLPVWSNRAQLKSNLSLIFVLEAVLYSVIPIYSAMDMNLCAKMLNSTTSKLIFESISFLVSSSSVMIRFWYSFILPTALGSISTVDVEFSRMAGPCRSWWAGISAQWYTGTSEGVLLKYISVCLIGSGMDFYGFSVICWWHWMSDWAKDRTLKLLISIYLPGKSKPNSS